MGQPALRLLLHTIRYDEVDMKLPGAVFNFKCYLAGPQPKKTAPVTRLPYFPTEYPESKKLARRES